MTQPNHQANNRDAAPAGLNQQQQDVFNLWAEAAYDYAPVIGAGAGWMSAPFIFGDSATLESALDVLKPNLTFITMLNYVNPYAAIDYIGYYALLTIARQWVNVDDENAFFALYSLTLAYGVASVTTKTMNSITSNKSLAAVTSGTLTSVFAHSLQIHHQQSILLNDNRNLLPFWCILITVTMLAARAGAHRQLQNLEDIQVLFTIALGITNMITLIVNQDALFPPNMFIDPKSPRIKNTFFEAYTDDIKLHDNEETQWPTP